MAHAGEPADKEKAILALDAMLYNEINQPDVRYSTIYAVNLNQKRHVIVSLVAQLLLDVARKILIYLLILTIPADGKCEQRLRGHTEGRAASSAPGDC